MHVLRCWRRHCRGLQLERPTPGEAVLSGHVQSVCLPGRLTLAMYGYGSNRRAKITQRKNNDLNSTAARTDGFAWTCSDNSARPPLNKNDYCISICNKQQQYRPRLPVTAWQTDNRRPIGFVWAQNIQRTDCGSQYCIADLLLLFLTHRACALRSKSITMYNSFPVLRVRSKLATSRPAYGEVTGKRV